MFLMKGLNNIFQRILRRILRRILFGMLVASVNMVSAGELLKTSTSWDGGDISYPAGDAEITSVKVALDEGQTLAFHCHPVPTFGYVLAGVLQVETKNGDKVLLKKGEAVLEVMKTVHRGTAVGGQAEILVFFAGAKSIPNTVLLDSEDAEKYCETSAR